MNEAVRTPKDDQGSFSSRRARIDHQNMISPKQTVELQSHEGCHPPYIWALNLLEENTPDRIHFLTTSLSHGGSKEENVYSGLVTNKELGSYGKYNRSH